MGKSSWARRVLFALIFLSLAATGLSISLCDGKIKVVQEALEECENRAESPPLGVGGDCVGVQADTSVLEATVDTLKADIIALKVEKLEMWGIHDELKSTVKNLESTVETSNAALKNAQAELDREKQNSSRLGSEVEELRANAPVATACTQLDSEIEALRSAEAGVRAQASALEAEVKECARELEVVKEAAGPRNAECSKLENDITELRSTYTLTSQKAIKHELENRKCLADLISLKDHKGDSLALETANTVLQDKLQNLESTCSALGEENAAAVQKAVALQIEVESWKQAANGKEERIENLQKKVDSSTDECRTLLKESQQENIGLQKKVDSKTDEYKDLLKESQEENAGLRREVQSLGSAQIVLETEKTTLVNANDALEQELQNVETTRLVMETDASGSKQALADLQAQLESCSTITSDLKRSQTTIEEEFRLQKNKAADTIEEFRLQTSKLEEERQELGTQNAAIKSKHAEWQQTIKALESAMLELETSSLQETQGLRQELYEHDGSRVELEASLSRQTQQISTLGQEKFNLEHERSILKSENERLNRQTQQITTLKQEKSNLEHEKSILNSENERLSAARNEVHAESQNCLDDKKIMAVQVDNFEVRIAELTMRQESWQEENTQDLSQLDDIVKMRAERDALQASIQQSQIDKDDAFVKCQHIIDELSTSCNTLGGRHLQALSKAEEQVRELQAEAILMKASNTENEATLQECQSAVKKTTSAESQNLKIKLQECKVKDTESLEAIDFLHTRAGALLSEVQSLRMSNEGKAIELQSCQQDCKTENLHARIETLEMNVLDCKALEKDSRESLDRMHAHAGSMETDLRDCQTGGGSTEAMGQLETRVDILGAELQHCTEEITARSETLDALHTRAGSLQTELQSLKTAKEEREYELSSCRTSKEEIIAAALTGASSSLLLAMQMETEESKNNSTLSSTDNNTAAAAVYAYQQNYWESPCASVEKNMHILQQRLEETQAIVVEGIGVQECVEGFFDWTFESTFWWFEFTYDAVIIVTEIVMEAVDMVSSQTAEIVNEIAPNCIHRVFEGVKGEILFVLGFFVSLYREHLEEHVQMFTSFLVELAPLEVREGIADEMASLVSFMGRRKLHAISVVAESEMHERMPYPLDTPDAVFAIICSTCVLTFGGIVDIATRKSRYVRAPQSSS